MADNTIPYIVTRGLGNLAGIVGAEFLPTRGFLTSTGGGAPTPDKHPNSGRRHIIKLASKRWG